MTTVTIAPAAKADGQRGEAQLPGRAVGLVREGRPFVTEVRPRVRRVRVPNGTEQLLVRPARRHGMPGPPRAMACDRSYAADLHGSRLTRRGRVVVGIIWLIFAAAIIFMVSRPAELPPPAETTTVTVKSGDTLWRLAGDVAPDADLRVTVDQIIELNGLRSAGEIQPGDLLVVPVVAD
jgi:nucleoid-associated protein YgaU